MWDDLKKCFSLFFFNVSHLVWFYTVLIWFSFFECCYPLKDNDEVHLDVTRKLLSSGLMFNVRILRNAAEEQLCLYATFQKLNQQGNCAFTVSIREKSRAAVTDILQTQYKEMFVRFKTLWSAEAAHEESEFNDPSIHLASAAALFCSHSQIMKLSPV